MSVTNDRSGHDARSPGASRFRSPGAARPRTRTVSLRVRLAAFVVCVMALVIGERTLSIFSLHADTLAQARGRVMDLVQQGVSRYSQEIAAASAVLSTLAAADTSPGNPTPEQCERLHSVLDVAAGIETLTLVDTDGGVVCTTAPGAVGLDLSGREYFRIAMRGVANLSSVRQSYVTQTPAIYMAAPALEDDGEVRSVVIARVGITELFPESFSSDLDLRSQVLLIDPSGVVIRAAPDNGAMMGRNLNNTPVVSQTLSQTRGTIIAEGVDSVLRLYGYSRLPMSNMHLIVGLDMAAVTREVERATWRAAMTLLVATVIMLIGLWLVGETLIVAPVLALSRRLARFGEGKREGDDGRVVITELAPLASAFEAMAEELTRREDALRSANRRLSSLASLDPLTGIANRRSFDAVFAVQWSTARNLALLMIDIDDFKPYNDHYGHVEGDRCLNRIAQALAATARGTDVVARIGGEEFAILMPDANLAAALELAERLRAAIGELGIEHAPALDGIVTISIGCAACAPVPGLHGRDLMMAADRALYAAKQAGRNRVCAAEAVQPAGGRTDTVSATARRDPAGG